MSSAEMGLVGQETEVTAKARRRQFTAEYKRRVLAEADACTKAGEIGALLRREALLGCRNCAAIDRAAALLRRPSPRHRSCFDKRAGMNAAIVPRQCFPGEPHRPGSIGGP